MGKKKDKAGRPERTPTAGELRNERHVHTCATIVRCAKYAATLLGIVLPFYFAFRSIEAIAENAANALVEFMVMQHGALGLSVTVNLYFLVDRLALRRANRQAVEAWSERIGQLQRVIDPDRSSSELTKQGDSPPDDL